MDSNLFNQKVGQRIRLLRKVHKYSQREIGELLGVTYQQFQKYESGQNRVNVQVIQILKHLWGVEYAAFFPEEGALQDIGNSYQFTRIDQSIIDHLPFIEDRLKELVFSVMVGGLKKEK